MRDDGVLRFDDIVYGDLPCHCQHNSVRVVVLLLLTDMPSKDGPSVLFMYAPNCCLFILGTFIAVGRMINSNESSSNVASIPSILNALNALTNCANVLCPGEAVLGAS